MIEIRPLHIPGGDPDDIDEVVASNADVHLETTDDQSLYITIRDAEHYVHLQVFHKGMSPLRVRAYESFQITEAPEVWQ